jgi:hypothetical protein
MLVLVCPNCQQSSQHKQFDKGSQTGYACDICGTFRATRQSLISRQNKGENMVRKATEKISPLSSGLPRMQDGEFQRVKLECEEQKNYQVARQLRNDVSIEKIKADGSDLKVEIQGERYKQVEFQLKGERIQTDIEGVKVETKAIELEGAQNNKWLTRQKVDLELERGKEALVTLSLDIDKLKGLNMHKRKDVEALGIEIVDRINVSDIKKRLFGA